MKCIVCGNKSFEIFHKGTRDNSEIDVMRCGKCRSLQLSSFSQIGEGFYEDGNMHKNQYSVSEDTYSEQAWDSWVNETKEDDYRRADVIRAKIERGGGKEKQCFRFWMWKWRILETLKRTESSQRGWGGTRSGCA